MGNYYEGDLEITLDPNKINREQLEAIIKKPEYIGKHLNFEINTLDSDIASYREYVYQLRSPRLDCSGSDLTKEEKLEIEEEIKQDFKDTKPYISLMVSCCTKHYVELETEKAIDNLISELAQYRRDDDLCNNLGMIQDEDQTYKRLFVWNEDELTCTIEIHKVLCNGCEFNYWPRILCDNWSICNRAYLIGKGLPIPVDEKEDYE